MKKRVSLPQQQIMEVYTGLEEKLQVFHALALHDRKWLASLHLFIPAKRPVNIHRTGGWIRTCVCQDVTAKKRCCPCPQPLGYLVMHVMHE